MLCTCLDWRSGNLDLKIIRSLFSGTVSADPNLEFYLDFGDWSLLTKSQFQIKKECLSGIGVCPPQESCTVVQQT